MNLTPYNPYGWNNPFQELISTEESYLHDLMDIVDGYLTVLEDSVNSDPTFDIDLNILFCNVRELLNLHIEFLKELKTTEQFKNVAQCFLSRKQQFVSEYTIYCNNYPNACLILKDINVNHNLKALSNFRICQQSLGHMLPLGAYLLKPVQRILKYPLLIKSMLKKAFTVNYKQFATNGYQEMKEAFDCMSQVAEEINLMKRKHELTLHINEIQSMLIGWNGLDLNCYGELILEEQLKIKGYRKERHIFLFEKLFLVTKKEEDVYINPMHIFVENLMLLETPKEGANFLKIYEHKNPQKYFLLDFSQQNSRKDWVNAIKKLILLSGPAMSENYRKRILEACQTITEDFTHSNDHSSSHKFRDLANITKKRFRITRAKRSHNTTNQLISNTDEITPIMRHSATFSQNNAKRLNPDVNMHKRLSDVTDYDMQYFENEIRKKSESSDASKHSIDNSMDDLSSKGSFPETMQRYLSSPEYNTDLVPTTTVENEEDVSPTQLSTSISTGSLSKKSPTRKGAIRRKTNTYLQKKLSETFTAQTVDEFGVKAAINLRRRHTDKEVSPDILDTNSLEKFKADQLKTPVRKPENLNLSEIDNSKCVSKSPEYSKSSIQTEENSERKRSRIMESESPFDSEIFDFTSPNASTSVFNESTPTLKLKNNTLTRNKASRRAQAVKQNSTAKKRLLFEDAPFKPDPNIFDKSPSVHLNLYFPETLGELKFSSTHSVDDCFIGKKNYSLNFENKYNTVRSKKSSMKALFDEKQDLQKMKRYNSVPYSCDVSNIFNLFNPVTSTPLKDNPNQEKTSKSKDNDIELSSNSNSVFDSLPIEKSQLTHDDESTPNEKYKTPEKQVENPIETEPNLDNFVDDEFNYLDVDDSSTNLIENANPQNEDTDESKKLTENIVDSSEISEKPSKIVPTSSDVEILFEKNEIFTNSLERNEIVKNHVLLDGPPSDNSDSDSIRSQNSKNSEPLNSPGYSIESLTLDINSVEKDFSYTETTPTSDIHEEPKDPSKLHQISETDLETTQNGSYLRNRGPNHISHTDVQPIETKRNSNYGAQILQFVFIGSISLFVAVKVLYEVYCNRQ